MDAKQFLAEFGHIANAKGGVQRLRELILHIAVSGDLVTMNEVVNAKPLIRSIQAQKKAHKDKRKIVKNQANISRSSIKVPIHWAVCRLGDLVLTITGGGTPSKNNPSYWGGDIPWASVKDLKDYKYISSTQDFITKKGLEESSSNLIPENRIIVCTRMGLGKIVINTIPITINQDLKALELPNEVNIDFFHILYKTRDINGKGITVAGIKQNQLLALPAVLPPLEEQVRIVAKVNELMVLCDQLEAQQQQKRKLQNRLRQTSLQAVANANNPTELKQHWQRLYNNFELLFSKAEDIDELKNLIPTLAIQGKLIHQIPTNTKAKDELLELYKQKQQIVKKGKFKSFYSDLSSNMIHQEFAIPSHWIWCHLDDIAAIARGGSPRPIKSFLTTSDDGLNWIKISDSIRGEIYIENSNQKIKPEGLKKTRQVFIGDLILSNSMSFGFPYILKINGCIHDGWLVIRMPEKLVNKLYIYYLLRSEHVKKHFSGAAKGAVVKNLNADIVKQLHVPLPPLVEQKRIIKRVSELMQYCDTLESKLHKATTTAENLATATIASLTGIQITKEEKPLKIPQTELIAPLQLGNKKPSKKDTAPLASLLARHNGEMQAKDLWQRFGSDIDIFYAQLKTEVKQGWIDDPSYIIAKDDTEKDKYQNNPKLYPDGKRVAKVIDTGEA